MFATELCKVHHGLAPELMNIIFYKRNVTYNFRKNSTFETRNKSLFIAAQKQYPLQAQKYGNFCQVTLRIQQILTSSNQILNLGNLKTVHAVRAVNILQTYDLLNYDLFYKLIIIYFSI